MSYLSMDHDQCGDPSSISQPVACSRLQVQHGEIPPVNEGFGRVVNVFLNGSSLPHVEVSQGGTPKSSFILMGVSQKPSNFGNPHDYGNPHDNRFFTRKRAETNISRLLNRDLVHLTVFTLHYFQLLCDWRLDVFGQSNVWKIWKEDGKFMYISLQAAGKFR